MEARAPSRASYDSSNVVLLAIALVILVSLLAGCANVTVTNLADRCYASGGKASVSFAGDTGKVDCK